MKTEASKESDKCLDCGRPRSEHHGFIPIILPSGCKCSPDDWASATRIPSICTKFEPMHPALEPELCRTCEHEEECHG